jgi:hypothetical protein
MLTAAAFAEVGLVLPLRYEGDGTLVDANGTVACQIDPNCEMEDARCEQIAGLIIMAVNFFEGEEAA